ncbi:hypothetical protein [Methylobacterium frigidaeris]|uniref:Uncharacterized protein n=1 Tax=Methylobacterium frigidaeris TaxID=2038277 RepID=A0AA37M6V3_9HYPH|nr:hypothetical protein [Methylobacterium frigidaeris]PIK69574.1 hypothetical protein CS379_29105 [Methylobacterium frigidaeris]GJD65348.1 hypothetical protein MPEAHAMD_5536 [Methylobacterium frigidaeris]
MSERRPLAVALACGCLAALLPAVPAAAEPRVTLLDLPFRVTQLRDQASEAALAVTTAGLPQLPRKAGPVAVVWGEGGAAVLTLSGDRVAAVPLPLDAIEGLTAGETPKGALPGTRRVLAGPVSAYLSGPSRAPDGRPGAAGVTVRERQKVTMSADPKPVPVATATVPPGAGAVFSADTLRPVEIDGSLNLLALGEHPEGTGLAVIGRQDGAWRVRAETPPEPGPLALAADLPGQAPGAVLVRGEEGRLEHWSLAGGKPARQAQGARSADGKGFSAPGAVLGGEVVVASRDRAALAYVSLKDLTERTRATLPAPIGPGLAVLGNQVVAALADGRLAVLQDGDARP